MNASRSMFWMMDGSSLCRNGTFRRTAFPEGMAGRLVRPFTEQHLRLWERGWKQIHAT